MKNSVLCCASAFLVFDLCAAGPVRDLNTPREFPPIKSKAEWIQRAGEIREHVRFSAGLWPLEPARAPAARKIFDRVERDGYSVEKVYLQTFPGFFLAGNLYRPLGQGAGSFPGILNPHGHWANGRMADNKEGSIAGRCISFARQGMVAFSYDMVGYNDTMQVGAHRSFATNATNLLWNISLMQLQTINSMAALDFLESLPDVDRKRLACTGESGGGTQTFILGAVDNRLAAQAPVVMVSHSMQGGCLCENAPGLRVDYSNMEIAAAVAPRPQMLVAATGDWTKKTMEVEGPSIERIYDLLGAKDRFEYAIFDYPHNYNKTSREAVYPFFGRWLLHDENPAHFKEQPFQKEPDAELRVFSGPASAPDGALNEAGLIERMVRTFKGRLQAMQPRDKASLAEWKKIMRPAWEHALHLQHVRGEAGVAEGDAITLQRQPGDSTVRLELLPGGGERAVVLIAGAAKTDALVKELNEAQMTVALLEEKEFPKRDQLSNFYHTYNRTELQDRVADLKVAVEYLQERFPRARVMLVGQGRAGLACLAAAPLVSGVAADCSGIDETDDQELLKQEIFFPGLRRIGSLQGMVALAVPNPLFLHNLKDLGHPFFIAPYPAVRGLQWLQGHYTKEGALKEQNEPASQTEIARWVVAHAR